jgi:hypothetical protein
VFIFISAAVFVPIFFVWLYLRVFRVFLVFVFCNAPSQIDLAGYGHKSNTFKELRLFSSIWHGVCSIYLVCAWRRAGLN